MFLFIFKGGPIIYLLLLCSFVGVYIIIQKMIFLRIHKTDIDLMVERVKNRLLSIGKEQTIKELRSERNMMAKVLTSAIKLADLPREDVKEGLKAVTLVEIPKLEKNMSLLSSIITVAPILGLLGTVIGLMDIFQVISGGGIGDATALSSGIAQALITTVAGLSIAIPFIFFHQYLAHKIDSYILDMERVMIEILNFYRLNSKGSS